MVIQKFTNNLFESEVYRELERGAVRKGFFTPTDEQRVKIASNSVNSVQEIDTDPSKNFELDVLRLAAGLREKGFEKQAQNIEQNLAMYKKAESELYGVTQNKNKDYIDFAHRDGDFNVVPGDLGTIETVESAAEKIRTMIGKTPTGKLPKEASLAEISSMIKQAAESAEEIVQTLSFDKDYIVKNIDALINILNKAMQLNLDSLQLNNAAADSLYRALGADPQQYYNLMKFYNAAFGNQAPSAEVVVNKIMANPHDASQYLATIGPEYKIASRENSLLSLARRPTQRSSQMDAQELAQLKQKAQAVAQQIKSKFEELKYNAERQKSIANKTLNSWKEGTADLIKNLEYFKNRATGLKSPKDYLTFAESFSKYLPTIEYKIKAPAHLFVGFGDVNSSSSLKNAISTLKRSSSNLINSAKEAIKVSNEELNHIRATAGRLASIAKKINEAKEEGLIDEGSGLNTVLNNVNQLRKIIKAYGTGGKEYLLKKLEEHFEKFDDYKEFDVNSQLLDKEVSKQIEALRSK